MAVTSSWLYLLQFFFDWLIIRNFYIRTGHCLIWYGDLKCSCFISYEREETILIVCMVADDESCDYSWADGKSGLSEENVVLLVMSFISGEIGNSVDPSVEGILVRWCHYIQERQGDHGGDSEAQHFEEVSAAAAAAQEEDSGASAGAFLQEEEGQQQDQLRRTLVSLYIQPWPSSTMTTFPWYHHFLQWMLTVQQFFFTFTV